MNLKQGGTVCKMECKGAIFDMDGLLFDTEFLYQQTWQEIARERGTELRTGFTGAISGTNGAYMCNVIEEYYNVTDGTAIMEECMERVRKKLSVHVPVKKGVFKILDFFREKDVNMAVASSSAREQIESNLETAGIRDYFKNIASGMEVRCSKPASDIFIYTAGLLGCAPFQCVVFEDSGNGIKAGYTAGCTTIMVPDLTSPSPGIIPYCTKICTDLIQAKKEVEKMFF